MNLQRIFATGCLLPVLMAGCSTTTGSRFGGTPQSRSIAVVGERPLPASTGEPGGRVAADDEEPEPKLDARRRISGRVIDEAGEPVAGATVRLADGSDRGGKEIKGTTDRTGAFSLNGLRPGSIYVLIAEADNETGPTYGRVEAKTAETGVEIALASEEKKPTARRSSRPAKAKPVSNREDQPEGGLDEPEQVNREDVASPAGQDEDGVDSGPPQPIGRPKLSPPGPGVGWKNTRSATAGRPKDEIEDGETKPVVSKRRTKVAPAPVEADDESNPLPPAINRGASAEDDDPPPARPASARSGSSARLDATPGRNDPESGQMALAGEDAAVEGHDQPLEVAKVDAGPAAMPMPVSTLLPDLDPIMDLPPVGTEAVRVAAHEAPDPTASPPPAASPLPKDVAPSKPASQPVFASQGPAPPASEKSAAQDDYNPFASLSPGGLPLDQVVRNEPITEPTPAAASTPLPAAVASTTKKWGDVAVAEKPEPAATPSKLALTAALFRRMRPPTEVPKETSLAVCVYDARLLKLNDFRLPDLEGHAVRFQDIDADFVLLDFWGTWCEPCLESIPHLVEIQKKYGPARLKVVGVACEQSPVEQRRAKVDEVARKLGINYPVLLSGMDGKPCPVQQALQIQAMPTLILVDRRGRVLWRVTGATPATESRLDRVLALNLNRGEAGWR